MVLQANKAIAERATLINDSIFSHIVSAMNTTKCLFHLLRNYSFTKSREYDALVSTGENISASLLAMSLNELGLDAISLTGSAGIFTETLYAKAKILDIIHKN